MKVYDLKYPFCLRILRNTTLRRNVRSKVSYSHVVSRHKKRIVL